MKLAELQREFTQHLLHNSADLEKLNITGPFAVEQLLGLYRNNFYISCSDYLNNCFPSVAALVGEEFFAQLAKAFIMQQPLTCASIEAFGSKFAAFIRDCEQTQSLPYLEAIAELDWGFDKVKSVTEITDFPFQQLQQLTEEQQLKIQFQLTPQTLLINSKLPVLKIWLGIHSGNLDDIDMQQGEYVILHPDREQGAKYYTISEQQFTFLSAVAKGESLATLATLNDFQQQLNHFISHAVINNFILEGEL